MFTYLWNLPMSGGPNESARAFAEESISERFDGLESQRLRYQSTIPMRIDLPPRPGQVIPATAYFGALDGAEDQVTLLEGRYPEPPTLTADGSLTGPIEIAMPERAAGLYGVGVGSEVNIVDGFDECDREPDPPPGGPAAATSSSM